MKSSWSTPNGKTDWSYFADFPDHKTHFKKSYKFGKKYKKNMYLSLLKLVKINGITVEIGCGCGHFGEIAKEKGITITYGIDMHKKLLKVCTGKYKKVLLGNVTKKLPLKDNSIDIIFVPHVIAHVTDKKKAMIEIRRVLKNNGYMILTMHDRRYLDLLNLAKLIIKRRPIRKTDKLFDPLYFNQLDVLVKTNGFNVIKHYKTYFRSMQVLLARKEDNMY